MRKIKRITSFIVAVSFLFNSVNCDVIVNALENTEDYAEEQQKTEEQVTEAVTTTADVVVSETTGISETAETVRTTEGVAVTDTTEISEETVTTSVSETTVATEPAVTETTTATESKIDLFSSDTSDVAFENILEGDTVISASDKTEYTQNTMINGSLTVKSELHVKQGTVIEVDGDLIIESGAVFNVSEGNIKTVVRGNLIIGGQFRYTNSTVVVEGNVIENGLSQIEGQGTVVLTGDKQQIIDTNSRIYGLVNRNKSQKPLVFINSLNFEKYEDNGEGIITYLKDENGDYTDKTGTVTVENKLFFVVPESSDEKKELVIYGDLDIKSGDISISSDPSADLTLRIKGDYLQEGGSFKTSGQKMIVEGDYTQNGGTFQIMNDGSKLSVSGNMTIQGESEFLMTHENTNIVVDGNFIVENSKPNQFANGTVEIKGDFTQKGTGDNFRLIDKEYTVDKSELPFVNNNVFILNGNGKQKISFESPTKIGSDGKVLERNAQFATLKISKYLEEYEVTNNLSSERIFEYLDEPQRDTDDAFQFNNGEPYRIRRNLNTPLSDFELIYINGYIHAVGGTDESGTVRNEIIRYDINKNKWINAGSLNTGRADYASAAVNNTIYVTGGFDGKNVLDSMEAVSTDGKSETVKLAEGNSLIASKSHKAVYYNGKVYIMGGENKDGEVLNTLEVFDPEKKTVEVKASMNTSRKDFGATLYLDGDKFYIIAAGGENSDGILKSVEVYDPETDTWTAKPDMQTARKDFSLEFIMGKLFAVGGITGESENGTEYAEAVEGFDGQKWITLKDGAGENIVPSEKRANFGSVAAYNSIFIAGGENPSKTDTFEQFMPLDIPAVRFKGNSKGLNGDFTQEEIDLAFNGSLACFSLDRVFNSQFIDEKSDFLGYGWKFGFESSLKKLNSCAGKVTNSVLNIRETPQGRIVGSVEKGTVLEVTGTKKDGYGQDWYEISAGSDKYYVFAEYVEVDEKNKDAVVVTYPDGMKGYFTGNDKDGYHANFGTYDKISFTDENTCELTTKEQVKYVYTKDSSGIYRNTLITDRYGNTVKINYTYDSEKKSGKIEVTGCNGDKITVTRSGEEVSATDNYGRKVIYKLNEDGELTEVTDSAGLKKTYEYSGKNIVNVSETNENGTITLCKVEYDKSGRISKYIDADGYESSNYYEDVYMDENNKAAGIAGDLRRCVVDANGNETVTKYSLVEKRPVKVIDAVKGVASYKYEIFYKDSYVDVTNLKDSDELYESTYKEIMKGQYPTRETVTDSNYQTTVIEKDERGNVTKKTNPDGSYTEYKYDGRNNLLEERNDTNGHILKTVYTYDESGVFLKSVKLGNSGNNESYEYDGEASVKGLVKLKTTQRDSTHAVKTEYTYNDKGELISEKTGNRETYYAHSYGSYDADKELSAGGKKIIAEKPQNEYEKCIFYVCAKVKPEGNTEISYFDSRFNNVKTTAANSDGTEKSTSLTVYDRSGRKIREVKPEVYAKDPGTADVRKDLCHTYKYNNTGLLTEETDEEGNTTRYKYDKVGNLTEQTDPGNASYLYEYDALNRIIKKTFTNGSVTKVLESCSYEKGTANSHSDQASKRIHTEYIDDENGLCTDSLLDYAGRETVSLTPYKKIVREYYGDGNVKKESVYDNADNPKCVSDVLYFYNDLGLLDITLTGYKPGETYFISKTLYTYDGLPEYEITYLDAQKTDTSSPTVPEKANASVVKYEYDESGNVLSESSYIGEFALADLASVKFAKKSEKEYDVKNYTITEKSGKIKTVTKYNYLDKPVTVKDVVRSTDIISADKNEETELTTVNTYDKNGNLIKTVTPAGAVTEYRYDSLDRITETIQNGVPAEEGNGKTGTLSESISYNWAGSVTKKILKFGNQVKSESAYYYDSRNNMVLSVDKVGNNEAASAFEYNNAGLVIVEAAPESFDGVNSEETDPVKKYSVSNASSKIRYIYDAAGRLKLKKFEGVTYKFDKKSDGMTASDSSFVVKAYSYDANDNIIKEVEGEEYSKAEESGDISKAKGTTYTYSGTNNVITECYPECDKEYSALYDYDALGNVTMEKILKGTSGSEKYAVTTTSYSQGEDGITSYVQKTTEEGNEDVSSVSPMLSVKSWKTDVNGNIIEESIGKNTVKKEYNTLGLESRSVSEADRYEVNGEEKIVNSEVKTIYDKAGNPAVIINNSGITEINEYDILNRLVSKTTGKRSADIADNALTADKLTDSVTQKWSYDVQGNVRCEYDGNGFKTEYQYDELNRLVNTIQKYGSDKTAETRKSYDLDGNLTEEVSLIDGNQTGKESFVYDGLGRVVQKSDASGEYEFIEYNRNSDQEYSYDAQYAKKSFEYNSERQLIKTEFAGVVTEEQEYDYAGNVSKKIDGEGNAVLYYYDVLDRLVKVTSKGKDSEAEAETASYTYNDEGNIATKTAGSKNKVSYQYTGSGEIKETIANGKTDKFFYNSDGRLERSVDPAGNETVYTYTAQGLIAKEEVKSGGKVVITKSYTYDKNGNVLKSSVKENDKENVITRTYDELGRVTKKEATGSVTSEFVYDQFTEDKLLYEVNRYANGESTSNVYDESGRLKYVYSKDISKGTDESEYTEYTYDYKGRRTGITYPNGAKSEYVYYNNNNLKTLTNFVKDKEVEKYEYSYYKNNMMSEKKEIFDGVLQGTTSYCYDELGRLVSTKEKRNDKDYRDITYSYDDSGNRIKEESLENNVKETKSYSYGEGNLLLGYTVTTNDKKTDEVKYEYDKNGNLLNEYVVMKYGNVCSDKDKPQTQNSYNALNQLVSTKTSDFIVSNEYNAEGLRISKEVNSVNENSGVDTSEKTYYTYEYDKVIFETASNKPEEYIWNVQGINLISRQIGGEMFYCMYNGHADITRMVEANGELAEKYYYDEWGVETESLKYGDISGDGKVTVNDYSLLKRILYVDQAELTHDQQLVSDLNADGKTDTEDLNILKQILFSETDYCKQDTNKDGFVNEKNNIKYAGYFYDAETGLYYLNARFYDPETARFIQQDSYSGDIYDPLSLNLYTYSNNNPISYYDPTGHSAKSFFKSVKNTLSTALNVGKSFVQQNVDNAVNTAKSVAKALYQNAVVEPAKMLYNATQAASQNLSNNSSALKESGSAGNAFANFSKGILDTVENTAAGIYNLANDPLGTVAESVNYLRQDPIGHSFIGATYNYYKDVAQASYAHDWDTVEYKLGSGLINLAGFAAVGGKTESALNKVKFPNVPIIKDIPVPQVVMADTGLGIVPVITTVPVSATIPSAVVAGAAGVANAAAAGQVVYSVTNSQNDFNSPNKNSKSENTVRDGAFRAAEFSNNWKRASLDDTIEKFAPNSIPKTTDSGKIIYKNTETGIQIVYDSKGNYFRIEDTNKVGKRRYLDLDGKDVSNKIENGKQKGRSGPEYEAITHFYNIK